MKTILMFKAQKQTRQFRKNQKVWIVKSHGNHYDIRFKYRGSGRYVNGIIDKQAKEVGELKEIEVDNKFYERMVKPENPTSEIIGLRYSISKSGCYHGLIG